MPAPITQLPIYLINTIPRLRQSAIGNRKSPRPPIANRNSKLETRKSLPPSYCQSVYIRSICGHRSSPRPPVATHILSIMSIPVRPFAVASSPKNRPQIASRLQKTTKNEARWRKIDPKWPKITPKRRQMAPDHPKMAPNHPEFTSGPPTFSVFAARLLHS